MGESGEPRKQKEKMVVKVYGPIRAACPQRVLVCLLEKGVEFDAIDVALEAGEHKKPDFLERQVRIRVLYLAFTEKLRNFFFFFHILFYNS